MRWFILITLISHGIDAALPVDASFVVVDLKYNEERGVQICEMQYGAPSAFKGHAMFYEGPDLIGYKLVDKLSGFFEKSWTAITPFCDSNIKKLLIANPGWTKIAELTDFEHDQEFLRKAALPVKDPSNILSYHGFVFLSPRLRMDRSQFQKKYPGVILTDNAFHNYADNKYKMTKILMEHPFTKEHKPKWGIYHKNDENLVERIDRDIGSEMYVIKPTNRSCGEGVVILKKEELPDFFAYIFHKSTLATKDPAYRFWRSGKVQDFLVEEFISMDPVLVPHLDNKPYCPTLRFVFLLIFNENTIDITTLGGYYTLPKVSLSDEGSLNEKYKSYVYRPYFAKAPVEILAAAEEQIREVMEIVYRNLLFLEGIN